VICLLYLYIVYFSFSTVAAYMTNRVVYKNMELCPQNRAKPLPTVRPSQPPRTEFVCKLGCCRLYTHHHQMIDLLTYNKTVFVANKLAVTNKNSKYLYSPGKSGSNKKKQT